MVAKTGTSCQVVKICCLWARARARARAPASMHLGRIGLMLWLLLPVPLVLILVFFLLLCLYLFIYFSFIVSYVLEVGIFSDEEVHRKSHRIMAKKSKQKRVPPYQCPMCLWPSGSILTSPEAKQQWNQWQSHCAQINQTANEELTVTTTSN